MALFGSDVELLGQLKEPLSGISRKRRGSLEESLGRISGQLQRNAGIAGRPQSDYIPQELTRASERSLQDVDNALLGVLGEGSLQDYNDEQDYQRNIKLAKEIGSILSPSIIQQIAGGLGGAGNAALQFKSLYDSLGRQPRTSSGLPPNLSLFDPSSSGLEYYYGR